MDKMSRSGQDVTIAIILTVIVFLGTIAAFYQYVFTAKLSEIESLKQQRSSKEQTFNNYAKVVEEKLNYEDQLVALHKTWDENKHYFVNGLVDWNDKEAVRQTQFTIFQLYEKIFEAATFAGIEIQNPVDQEFKVILSETLEFHPDDEPFDFPEQFLFMADNWTFIPSERFPEEGKEEQGAADTGKGTGGAVGGGLGTGSGGKGAAGTTQQAGGAKSLFNAHDFTVQFEASYEQMKKFVEILQDLEGEESWVVSIHCFETSGDPLMFGFPSSLQGDIVLTNVKIPMEMFCTAYELYEPGAVNAPPNLPGATSCSPQGGGGGHRGGGGGGRRGGGGGGAGLGT
jgi:uncharacterized membrane protein YgcG